MQALGDIDCDVFIEMDRWGNSQILIFALQSPLDVRERRIFYCLPATCKRKCLSPKHATPLEGEIGCSRSASRQSPGD